MYVVAPFRPAGVRCARGRARGHTTCAGGTRTRIVDARVGNWSSVRTKRSGAEPEGAIVTVRTKRSGAEPEGAIVTTSRASWSSKVDERASKRSTTDLTQRIL